MEPCYSLKEINLLFGPKLAPTGLKYHLGTCPSISSFKQFMLILPVTVVIPKIDGILGDQRANNAGSSISIPLILIII